MTDPSTASTEMPVDARILRFLADAAAIMAAAIQKSPASLQESLLDRLKHGSYLTTRINHTTAEIVLACQSDEQEMTIPIFTIVLDGDHAPARWIN